MKLFNGQLLVIVRTHEQPGEINLTVSGKGLKTAKLTFQSK